MPVRRCAILLNKQSQRRAERAKLLAERLEKAHILGAWEGTLRLAQGENLTRGHFARFLVEQSKAGNLADVFKKHLAAIASKKKQNEKDKETNEREAQQRIDQARDDALDAAFRAERLQQQLVAIRK